MVASIGKIASPSQGASYYEGMVTTAKDDPEHREASAWAGKGANALGLSGPVDPEAFKAILEGRVPDGPRLGKRGKNSEIHRDIGTSRPNHLSIVDDIHPLPDAVEDLDLVLAPMAVARHPRPIEGWMWSLRL